MPVYERRQRPRPDAPRTLLALLCLALWAPGQPARSAQSTTAPANLPVLTRVEQIRRLSPEEARRGYPVRLKAVVTYCDPISSMLFVQDATAGIFVRTLGISVPLRAAQLVEVEGASGAGESYPVIIRSRFTVVAEEAPLPAPRPATIPVLLTGAEDCQWVETKGVVESAHAEGRRWVLIVGDGGQSLRVVVRQWKPKETQSARWVDAEVTVRGVCATQTRAGKLESVDLRATSLADIRLDQPPPAEPFAAEVQPVEQLLAATNRNHRVRVLGQVVQIVTNGVFHVQDASGRVLVRSRQNTKVRVGDWADLLGFAGLEQGAPVLRNAAFRLVGLRAEVAAGVAPGRAAAADYLPLLTEAKAVRALSVEQAKLGYPVRLTAVVTYYDRQYGHLLVQDATEGIFVTPRQPDMPVQLGKLVEVNGFSDPGDFAPTVTYASVAVLGEGALPAPHAPSVESLVAGREDSQWVKIAGVVQSVSLVDGHLWLQVGTGGRQIRAVVPGFSDQPVPEQLVDAEVRVTGVCGTEFNQKRQWLGVRIFTPSLEQVQVVVPASPDPFAVPIRSIGSILQFAPQEAAGHRVRVQGTVTLQQLGAGLFVADKSDHIFVRTRQNTSVQPGQKVDVVGFPGVMDYSPMLLDAVFRSLGPGEMLPAKPLSAEQARSLEANGELVSIQGKLLDVTKRPDGCLLALQAGRAFFEARLSDTNANTVLPDLQRRSRLALTGICSVVVDEARNPLSFAILLRSPADIVVLARPSWWTSQLAFRVSAGLAILVLAVLMWVMSLRRRVRAQMEVIRQRTAHQAALEEQYRLVWENSADGMRLSDQAGVMVKVNAAFCRLVGKPKGALEGQPIAVIYPEEKRAHVMQRHEERFCARSVAPHTERELTLWDGRGVWFDVSNSFFDARGQVPLLLGIFRDVTARKQEQAQRLAMERKLLDAQRLESLGVLAAGIAHDFNNLLTVTLGNANLVAMELPDGSPLRPCLHNIEQASLQAADLCKQMLAYAGRGRLQVKCLDLNETLAHLRHVLQSAIGKQAVLRYELAPALPLVEADAGQIRQVITSLASNAAEALGEKGGFVDVRTGVVQADRAYLEQLRHFPDLPEGDYVFLEVADNGCGMTPEVLARLFEPFFTTKFIGRGLGLPAAMGIARGHKGALQVWSEPGRGSTFRLLLPCLGAPVAEPREAAAPPPSWRGSGAILVVDDEEAVRSVIARVLKGAGFNVLLAPDGHAAVETLRAQPAPVRLVLLDLTMPQLGGEAAYDEIRKVNGKAPVILMSGYTEAEAVARFAGKPLAGFVQKPFKPDDLLGKVRAAVEKAEPAG